MVPNLDIRRRARAAGVPLWQLAKALGISEPTITRRLREELDGEEKERYIQLINSLEEGDSIAEVKTKP